MVDAAAGSADGSICLRPASDHDVTFVAQVYGRAMGPLLRSAGLDLAQQGALLLAQWNTAEIRIICVAGRDVGWIQVAPAPDALFIRNFCIEPGLHRRGLGSAVLRMMIAEAARCGKAVSLGVARGNPARRLYERFGFRVTHEDAQHHYMRRDP